MTQTNRSKTPELHHPEVSSVSESSFMPFVSVVSCLYVVDLRLHMDMVPVIILAGFRMMERNLWPSVLLV